ncbi:hypothetical protein BCS58_03330 [Enterovibrio norvegicus]|uniref:hypothetical protein n=1 Tax=Enterovibrio norvegicus TaxID=188144 RepID=UPI003899CDEF
MAIKYSNRTEVGLLYIVIVAFFCINYFWLFALTAPSDPLQYVAPALDHHNGFAFLDRTLLWIWIRLCSILPIDSNQVGGMSTLVLTTATLALGIFYCNKKAGFISASLYAILYIATPTIVDIASYTYPMQLLTFVLVAGLVFIDSNLSSSIKAFFIGLVFSLAIISKIQAYIFIVFSFFFILSLGGGVRKIIKLMLISILSSLSTLIVIFFLLGIIDGWSILKTIFEQYFYSNASVQYAGRAAGGFPQFYYYLAEPTSIIALFGLILPLILPRFRAAIIPASIGIGQLFGILLIYVVTQRGGPVISNYFLDSHVFGIIAFSVVMSISLSNGNINRNLVCAVVVAFFAYYAYLALTLPTTDSSYFPEHLERKKNIYFVILNFSLVSFFVLYFRFKVYISSTMLFFALILFVLPRMYQGVQGALFRKEFHEGYHITSELIRSLVDDGKSVWVDVSTNHYRESVYAYRLKQVYRAFFSQGQISGSMVMFSEQRPDSFDVLLTTNPSHAFDEMPIVLYREGKIKNSESQLLTPEVINASNESDYKIIGYRGFPLFKAHTVNCHSDLRVYSKTDDNYLALISYAKRRDLVAMQGQAVKITANGEIENLPENHSLDLFLQYLENDKWVRKTVKFDDKKTTVNGHSSIELTTLIPGKIKDLEYGWRVNASNGVSAPLTLPTPNIYMLRDKHANTIEYKNYTYWVLE